MIASSKSVKLLAVSAAALLHGAALWGLSNQADVKMEGASAAPEVTLGSSFADMAAGTLTPEVDPDVAPLVEPSATEPVQDLVPAETPELIKPVIAQSPETAQPTEFSARVSPTELTPVLPSHTVEPSTLVVPLPAQDMTPPVERAEAVEVETTAVSRSLRPKPRSESFEKKHEPKPVKQAVKSDKPKKKGKKQTQAQPEGNAKQNAKAGSATGQSNVKTKSASAGKAKKKQANGNAAASNYPGKVMRKIARVPKPRVGKKGSAVVAFTISANGSLASISLARSSGSGQLDKAALLVVRKAAPFPPPPTGARRSFSIKIKGV